MSLPSLTPRIAGEPERLAPDGARSRSHSGEGLRVYAEGAAVVDATILSLPDQSTAVSERRPVPCQSTRQNDAVAAIDWTFRDDEAAEELLVDGMLPLEAWRSAGRLRVVKQGPHRVVYRLEGAIHGGEAVYIKRFACSSWRDSAANAWRGTRARLEWNAAEAVAATGIPTIAPILLGEERRSVAGFPTAGASYLVTPEIAGSEPLDELLAAALSGGDTNAVPQGRVVLFRLWLARALGDLAGRLHHAKILHPDLHAGNLLVTGRGPGDWRLWLIDLHALRETRGLSPNQRVANVSELARFFLDWATRSDRARFLRAYRNALPVELRPANPMADRAERVVAEAALERSARWGAWRTDAAWRRGNRHVARRDGGGKRCRGLARLVLIQDPNEGGRSSHVGRTAGQASSGTPSRGFDDAVVLPRAARSWLDEWRSEPNEWVAARVLAWCKQSKRRQVAAVRGDETGAGDVVYAKRIVRSAWLERLSDLVRTPIVRHAWLVGQELLRRKIPTPEPMAYLVEPRGQGASEQWLLTAGVPDTTTVAAWLNAEADDVSRAALSAVGRRMAEVTARLHGWGYDHRDLRFANWLVRSGEAAVWLLDLDAVRRRPQWWSILTGRADLGSSRREQNLSRLAVSAGCHPAITHSDRLRFLRCYLAASDGLAGATDWKRWWRAIEARLGRKLRQNAERGRPVS